MTQRMTKRKSLGIIAGFCVSLKSLREVPQNVILTYLIMYDVMHDVILGSRLSTNRPRPVDKNRIRDRTLEALGTTKIALGGL